jgi:hypothetical protein
MDKSNLFRYRLGLRPALGERPRLRLWRRRSRIWCVAHAQVPKEKGRRALRHRPPLATAGSVNPVPPHF